MILQVSMSRNSINRRFIGVDGQMKNKSVYVQISPSTFRYQRLMELSQEFNCSYHRIALEAIDWYLRVKTPKKI